MRRGTIVKISVIFLLVLIAVYLHLFTATSFIGKGINQSDRDHFVEAIPYAGAQVSAFTFTAEDCKLVCMDWLLKGLADIKGDAIYKINSVPFFVRYNRDINVQNLGIDQWLKFRDRIIRDRNGIVASGANSSLWEDLFYNLDPSLKDRSSIVREIQGLVPFVVVERCYGEQCVIEAACRPIFGDPKVDGDLAFESSELLQGQKCYSGIRRYLENAISDAPAVNSPSFSAMPQLLGKDIKAEMRDLKDVLSPWYFLGFPNVFWKGKNHTGEFTVMAFDAGVVEKCGDNGGFRDRASVSGIKDPRIAMGWGDLTAEKICLNPYLSKQTALPGNNGQGWYRVWGGDFSNRVTVMTCNPEEQGCLVGRWADMGDGFRWVNLQKAAIFVKGGGILDVYVPAESLILLTEPIRSQKLASNNPISSSGAGQKLPTSGDEAIPTPTFIPQKKAPSTVTITPTVSATGEPVKVITSTIAPATAVPLKKTPMPTATVTATISSVEAIVAKEPLERNDGAAVFFAKSDLSTESSLVVELGQIWVLVEGPISDNGKVWGKVIKVGLADVTDRKAAVDALNQALVGYKDASGKQIDVTKEWAFVLWEELRFLK